MISQTITNQVRWLFPNPGPKTNNENINLKVNKGVSGGNSDDPDKNPFGFTIMSGEEDDTAY
jgi:hypothetical protein